MNTRILNTFVSAALLCAPITAQLMGGPLDFDFERINKPGHPADPGITYSFLPISDFVAEAPGITLGDVNNDGLVDVMFCKIEGYPNELYVNNGDGTFTESAAAYGVDEPSKRRGNSLLLDYDNDGDLDLITFGYPSKPIQNLDLYSLYRNDGSPGFGFTEVTASAGGFVLGPSAETTTVGDPGGAAAADYDRDGYLDVLVTYWHRNQPQTGYSEDQFRLWHNEPNPVPPRGEPDYSERIYVDKTLAAGIDHLGGIGWIWQPVFVDVDRDGYPDIHINVERDEDLLLMNLGNGTFAPNVATGIGMNFNGPPPQPAGAWGHEMGKSVADFDNDLDQDFYLTNPGTGYWNKADAFYRNETDLSEGGSGLAFTQVGLDGGGNEVALDSLGVGWGAVFQDLDNDCDLDLVTARGMSVGTAQNTVWRNLYPATTGSLGAVAFEDLLPAMNNGGSAWLGGCWDTARALVSFDYDADGDLDLIFTRNGNTPPLPTDKLDAAMYRNTLVSTNNWLELDLTEAGGSLNTVGARVFVRGAGGVVQMKEVQCGGSFLSQEAARLHFGLGNVAEADYVVVRWFDGSLTVVTAADDDLQGVVAIAHGADTFTGDLDGSGTVDEVDLQLLVTSLYDEATVDATVPSWPWRLTADVDGNGLVDRRDFASVRPLVPATWADIGSGLFGTTGVPVLTGSGTLVGGTPAQVDLSNALPSTIAYLMVGFDLGMLPLKGGILVPTLDLSPIGPLPVSGAGTLTLGTTWPVGLPSGVLIQWQMWIADNGGPVNASASNALSAITP